MAWLRTASSAGPRRRRQERRREDFRHRRRARQGAGIDQDVDRLLQPLRIDVAQTDRGDLGMVHLVLERLDETLVLDRNLDQRLALGDRGNRASMSLSASIMPLLSARIKPATAFGLSFTSFFETMMALE